MNKVLAFFNKIIEKRKLKKRREEKRAAYLNTLPNYYDKENEPDFSNPLEEPNIIKEQLEMFNPEPKNLDDDSNVKKKL